MRAVQKESILSAPQIYNGLLERDDWPSIADMAVGIIPQVSHF